MTSPFRSIPAAVLAGAAGVLSGASKVALFAARKLDARWRETDQPVPPPDVNAGARPEPFAAPDLSTTAADPDRGDDLATAATDAAAEADTLVVAIDEDGDGVPDAAVAAVLVDEDGDGVPDAVVAVVDEDADGEPDGIIVTSLTGEGAVPDADAAAEGGDVAGLRSRPSTAPTASVPLGVEDDLPGTATPAEATAAVGAIGADADAALESGDADAAAVADATPATTSEDEDLYPDEHASDEGDVAAAVIEDADTPVAVTDATVAQDDSAALGSEVTAGLAGEADTGAGAERDADAVGGEGATTLVGEAQAAAESGGDASERVAGEEDTRHERRPESHIADIAERPVATVVRAIADLSTDQLEQLFEYESTHRKRKTVLQAIERAAAPDRP